MRDDAVKVFGDRVQGHTHKMLFDTFRSMHLAEFERRYVHDEGFGPVARSMLAVVGKATSPELSARFAALEGCPSGSLGRKLWEMYRRHGWPFPGELMSVPEATTVHDWVHALAGYEPNPIGEIQVTTFIAVASPDEQLFGGVVLGLGLYEAGAFRLPSFPDRPDGSVMAQLGAPEGLADAIRRGSAVTTDLMEGIDHWALADEQVTDLRERFGVIP